MTDFEVWAQAQIAAIVEYFKLNDNGEIKCKKKL